MIGSFASVNYFASAIKTKQTSSQIASDVSKNIAHLIKIFNIQDSKKDDSAFFFDPQKQKIEDYEGSVSTGKLLATTGNLFKIVNSFVNVVILKILKEAKTEDTSDIFQIPNIGTTLKAAYDAYKLQDSDKLVKAIDAVHFINVTNGKLQKDNSSDVEEMMSAGYLFQVVQKIEKLKKANIDGTNFKIEDFVNNLSKITDITSSNSNTILGMSNLTNDKIIKEIIKQMALYLTNFYTEKGLNWNLQSEVDEEIEKLKDEIKKEQKALEDHQKTHNKSPDQPANGSNGQGAQQSVTGGTPAQLKVSSENVDQVLEQIKGNEQFAQQAKTKLSFPAPEAKTFIDTLKQTQVQIVAATTAVVMFALGFFAGSASARSSGPSTTNLDGTAAQAIEVQ